MLLFMMAMAMKLSFEGYPYLQPACRPCGAAAPAWYVLLLRLGQGDSLILGTMDAILVVVLPTVMMMIFLPIHPGFGWVIT